MKQIFTLLLTFSIISFLSAQPPCLPTNGGIPAGNDAPGCTLCGPIYQGSTLGYTASPPGSAGFSCGTIENNQFISIIVDPTRSLSATILASNCQNGQGVELVIYDTDFNEVSNCFTSGGVNTPGSVQANNLTPGEIVWVMIDGFNGDVCDILFTTGGISNPPNPPGPIAITPDTSLCPGMVVCYSVDIIRGATEYEWAIPPNAVIVSGGGLQDISICLEYIEPGGGIVKVTPSNYCFPGIPIVTPVVVLPILPTLLPPVFVCPEDVPNPPLPDTCYVTALGCDSCVTRNILPFASVPTILDAVICPGSCTVFGDSCYFNSTVINLGDTTKNGCDSVLILQVMVSDTTPPTINCTIDPSTNAININWNFPIGAGEFQVFINDSLYSTLSDSSYQFNPNLGNDTLMIEIQPNNSIGCNFQSGYLTCVISDITAVKNTLPDESVKIFPNPNQGIFNIETDFSIVKTMIYSSSGELLEISKERQIDISEQPDGVYLLKIMTDEGILVKKVMKF